MYIELSRGKVALIDDLTNASLPAAFRERLLEASKIKWSYTEPSPGQQGYAFRLIPKTDADGNILRKPGRMLKSGKMKPGSALWNTQYLHRFLMQDSLSVDKPQVDHKSGDRLDCRLDNMRPCTHAENMRNRCRQKQTYQRFKGVHRAHNRWVARIRFNFRNITIGTFKTETDAAIAYNNMAQALHGEFAHLNDLNAPMPKLNPIPHGKVSSYRSKGCRCASCTSAYSSYNRARMRTGLY